MKWKRKTRTLPPEKNSQSKSRIKPLLFWLCILFLAVFIGLMAYWDIQDTRGDVVTCAGEEQAGGVLLLERLDTESRQIHGTLRILRDGSRGSVKTLLVESATSDSENTFYERMLDVKTLPTPLPTPTPTPLPTRATTPTPTPAANPNVSSTASPTPTPSPTPLANPVHERQIIKLSYTSQSFFYPFEQYPLNFRISYEINGEPRTVKLRVVSKINELILGPCFNHYSFNDEGNDNEFSVVLKRHRFVRATAVVLYTMALVFLFYIATREETSKALSNSLGYLAALWGVREIIIGSSKLFPTVVDFLTLALFVTVVAIVAYKPLVNQDVAQKDDD
ncbi:MAG TPA: hypothetical protein VF666_13405 [Pyrinomonadaceae bacterium]|jgi:cell division septation protein DedD